MSKHQDSANKALYEQQESQLSAQSSAFINLLTKRGILEDREIDNDRIRQAQKEKKRNMYHNTLCSSSIIGTSSGRWSAFPQPLQKNWITRWVTWMPCWTGWIWSLA